MAFKEVRLDIRISYDSVGGPMYKTNVIELPGGTEFRRGWWANGRKKWRIKKELLSRAEVELLEAFFRNMRGKLHGFRLRDWNSYKKVDEPLPLLTNTTAQLQFKYTEPVTSSVETQKVLKPVLSADVVASSTNFYYAPDITLTRSTGGAYTAFAASGNWSLNRATGIITFTASQAGNSFKWSGSYDWPVRFDSDEAMFHREESDIHDWSDINLIELKQL